MSLINLAPFCFGGKPHFPDEMAADGSFATAWNEFQQSPVIKTVMAQLRRQNLPINWLGITQFGPENFVYWMGLLIPNRDWQLPKDWLKLELPGGPGFALPHAAPATSWLPIQAALAAVYQAAQKEQITLPQNISYTAKPYFVEQLSFEDPQTPQYWTYFVYQGQEEAPLED